MMIRKSFIWFIILLTGKLHAQDYNAVHGSDYAGSLGVYNNPSSILSSPYKWDLTLFALQYQTISNALKGPNFPFNLAPSSTFFGAQGNYKRYADVNSNLRLLNGRYAINKNNAIAFGINARTYLQAHTSPIHYSDSVAGPRSFLFLNEPNGTLNVGVVSSSWLELYGTYATTFWDRTESRLNGGISLKLARGLSGAFVKANDVRVERQETNDQIIYKIAGGDARYGYSANLGDLESITTADVLKGSGTGFAIDLGIEYMIRSQTVSSVYDEVSATNYDWKIGVSLLDLGWNQYEYSNQSYSVSSLNADVSSFVLQEKFRTISNVGNFNDSLASIVNNHEPLTGNFKIINPARAVVNVDRYVSGNIFVNAELSVNLSGNSLNSTSGNYSVRESKFLTVTPRWETRKLGFYLPTQVTRHGNFWIGAAVKAGPLLLGTHNLLNAFSKNKYLASGAYVAIIIRPFGDNDQSGNRQYDCPNTDNF